jgi:predicted RNA-binding protein YlqC (UPF0109 family)
MQSDARLMIEEIARTLVKEPDQVKVREEQDQGTTILELSVGEEDLGRVIGKQGRTARSMRTLLNAVGNKSRKRYQLEIVE